MKKKKASGASEIEWQPICERSMTEGPLWDGWETEDDFMTPRGRDQGQEQRARRRWRWSGGVWWGGSPSCQL